MREKGDLTLIYICFMIGAKDILCVCVCVHVYIYIF